MDLKTQLYQIRTSTVRKSPDKLSDDEIEERLYRAAYRGQDIVAFSNEHSVEVLSFARRNGLLTANVDNRIVILI